MSQKAVTDALSAVGIGVSQEYLDVTSERIAGTWYINNTGKPIFIVVCSGRDSAVGTEQTLGKLSFQSSSSVVTTIPFMRSANSGGAQRGSASAIVPVGAKYTVTLDYDGVITSWWELR
ncbi:hypothetical protein [Edwardsiella tarda]|uniref:hypothetical protein n=1 Tax=Edwardsiella tarda TaxID=636 RepID=UPI00351C6BA4